MHCPFFPLVMLNLKLAYLLYIATSSMQEQKIMCKNVLVLLLQGFEDLGTHQTFEHHNFKEENMKMENLNLYLRWVGCGFYHLFMSAIMRKYCSRPC